MAAEEGAETRIQKIRTTSGGGLPWRASGQGAALPLQGARVPPPVQELRFCMLHGEAKR